MRFIALLSAIILLPSIGFAQKNFSPGTYELANGTKGEGDIDYKSGAGAELVVKSGPKNKKVSYSPQDVKSFRAYGKNFVSVHDFTINSGLPMSMNFRIKHDFAEVLDTGRVELLDYSFMMSNMAKGSNPGEAVPSAPFSTGCALIRRRGGPLSCVPSVVKKGRPVIATFIKDRPDLVARLNKEEYSAATVRSIIQAYNSGQKQ